MTQRNSIAKKRAAMRLAPEEDPEFQIAPMIDILLVLLVFFMSIASTEVLQSNDQVKLPVAKDSKEKQKGVKNGQSIINVLWNPLNNAGSIEVDEQKYSAAPDIIPVLQKKIVANPDMRIFMRVDKNVRYEYLRALLVAAASAGVTNVTFAVVDKESGAPAPAPASP